MVRAIGGDLVGMSTTLEAIAAREAGAEVLGISLVTNLAAGMTGEPLNHEEVLEAGRAAATRMGELLAAGGRASCDAAHRGSGSGARAPGSADTVDAVTVAEAWLAEDPDPDTRAELQALLEAGDIARGSPTGSAPGSSSARRACAARSGAGPNRMNRVVVTQAAAGLAAYIEGARRQGGRGRLRRPAQVRRVRPRHRRGDGGRRAARARCSRGRCRHRCWRSRSGTSAPTPASWSPRRTTRRRTTATRSTSATASQIVPPADAEISAAIEAVGPLAAVPRGDDWETLGDEVLDAYLDRVAGLVDPASPATCGSSTHRCTGSAATSCWPPSSGPASPRPRW